MKTLIGRIEDSDRKDRDNDREDFAAGVRYALWLAVKVGWKKKVELVGFCVLVRGSSGKRRVLEV